MTDFSTLQIAAARHIKNSYDHYIGGEKNKSREDLVAAFYLIGNMLDTSHVTKSGHIIYETHHPKTSIPA